MRAWSVTLGGATFFHFLGLLALYIVLHSARGRQSSWALAWPMSVVDHYEIDFKKRYGSGGYGVTVACKDKATGEELAVKLIDTSKQKVTAIQKECDIMHMLDHHNVIKCKGHGVGEGNYQRLYFIFMELATGGELFSQVIDRGTAAMPEPIARRYFEQIVDALRVCHCFGVAHRDLQLENVLLNSAGVVKLIDFGLAHIYPRRVDGSVDRSKPLTDVCGSKSYAAPEVLAGRGYDGFACDAWSLGVSLFAMVSGFFPLDEASKNDWRFVRLQAEQAKGGSSTETVYGWYRRTASHLSPELVDLLDKLLTIDPQRRLTLDAVKEHPWVKKVEAPPNTEVMGDEQPIYRSINVGGSESSPSAAGAADFDEMPVCKQRATSRARSPRARSAPPSRRPHAATRLAPSPG